MKCTVADQHAVMQRDEVLAADRSGREGRPLPAYSGGTAWDLHPASLGGGANVDCVAEYSMAG